MALPKSATPTYELKVPTTGENVKYRPFLVKEEKTLLLAHQSENIGVMIDTLKTVIDACTFGILNIDKLAMVDIEYIFIQLRAKSVGEISELNFSCKKCEDPKAKMKVNIDLTQLEVTFNPEHKKDIELFDDVGVRMKYPSIDTINKLKNVSDTQSESIFDIIVDCIDCVYDSDNVYPAIEQSRQELIDFVDNLTQEQFLKLQQFFETMPKLEKVVEFDCPICGYHHVNTIQGLDGFF